MRWTYSMVATIAPGPTSSGVPSGTKATLARSSSASVGSPAFPVSSSSATSSRSSPPGRPGPGGLGNQGLVGTGRGGGRAHPVAGQAAVIVAATGGDQAEVAGEAEQAGLLGLRRVGGGGLDPRQAGRGAGGRLDLCDRPL